MHFDPIITILGAPPVDVLNICQGLASSLKYNNIVSEKKCGLSIHHVRKYLPILIQSPHLRQTFRNLTCNKCVELVGLIAHFKCILNI